MRGFYRPPGRHTFVTPWRKWKEDMGEMYFRQVLELTKGNVAEAASVALMGRREMYDKIAKYNIDPNEWRKK